MRSEGLDAGQMKIGRFPEWESLRASGLFSIDSGPAI